MIAWEYEIFSALTLYALICTFLNFLKQKQLPVTLTEFCTKSPQKQILNRKRRNAVNNFYRHLEKQSKFKNEHAQRQYNLFGSDP